MLDKSKTFCLASHPPTLFDATIKVLFKWGFSESDGIAWLLLRDTGSCVEKEVSRRAQQTIVMNGFPCDKADSR